MFILAFQLLCFDSLIVLSNSYGSFLPYECSSTQMPHFRPDRLTKVTPLVFLPTADPTNHHKPMFCFFECPF